jgi:hypothetical protein
MTDFAILSDKLNVVDSIPSILLPSAFLQAESRNVFEQHGEYKALRGRLLTIQDADGVAIQTPTDAYVITSIVAGTSTINITGDHSAGNTPLDVGDTIRLNGGTEADNETLFTVATLPTTGSITTVETLTADATPGNVFVGFTPIIRHHRHTKQKGSTEFLLVATRYNVFLWTNSTKTLSVKFTTASPATETTHWDIITHQDNVYATNNIDVVQKWDVRDDPANNFAALGAGAGGGIDIDGSTLLTACKFLASHEGYLFLFYTTEGGGANNVFAQRGRWSSRRDDTDFNENSAGDAGRNEFDNTPAFITGVGKKDSNIYIFTNGDQPRTYYGWLTTESIVWVWDEKQVKTGCLSHDTIVNDKSGRLFYLSSDLTVREIDTPELISRPVDKTIRGINLNFAQFAQATFIDEFDHIYLAIASGSSETNDIVLDLTVSDLTWNIHEIPVRSFGDYTRQDVFTYDTLPYDTYEEWGEAWVTYDSDVNVLGFPLDLASDYFGRTYELHAAFNDAGEDYTRSMVIGTTFNAVNVNKRINNGVVLYFNREAAGTINVYVKRDDEANWLLVGTASLADAALPTTVAVHVPFDVAAKFLKFKLESTDYFEFIGAVFNEYEIGSYR